MLAPPNDRRKILMGLSGKTVIITGATSGIGAACVREFLQCGARIVLVGRDKERADGLLSEIHAKNGEGMIMLASDDASYVVGAVLSADGGSTAR
jgi:NADP-dependent 3-hydroxy acid dehydrogenase YdfG